MIRVLSDFVAAMLLIVGAGAAEELDESAIERFESLRDHPVGINTAGRSRLLACGLFSAYQVASLCDYRASNGDVLSITELGLVDGFNPELAEALSHFISLESYRAAGQRPRKRLNQSLMLQGTGRWKDSSFTYKAGAKYSLHWGETAEFYWSGKYQDGLPGSFSLALYGKRGSKLVLGDFNARFGQGLILWSGLSLSGVPTEAAMKRNGTGLAPTGSYSPLFRGCGWGLSRGRFALDAAVAFPGLRDFCNGNSSEDIGAMGILAASYLGRRLSLGVQGYVQSGAIIKSSSENVLGVKAAAGSFDWKLGFGRFLFYGEGAMSLSRSLTAWNTIYSKDDTFYKASSAWAFAGVAGLKWSPAYRRSITLLARHYPVDFACDYSGAVRSASKVRDESGVSLGTRLGAFGLTLDGAVHPVAEKASAKAVVQFAPSFSLGSRAGLQPSVRYSVRVSGSGFSGSGAFSDGVSWRHDGRVDLRASLGSWQCNARYNAVYCKELAHLGYLETGYKRERFQVFVRGTIFNVANWDDRIYCYQRDTPGSFNILAAYGHGYVASVYTALRLGLSRGQRTPLGQQASQELFLRTGPQKPIPVSAVQGSRSALRHTLYLRASLIRYPWSSSRTPHTDLKLQYLLRF